MPDISALLNNPATMNYVSQMMQNPAMMQMYVPIYLLPSTCLDMCSWLVLRSMDLFMYSDTKKIERERERDGEGEGERERQMEREREREREREVLIHQ